jgi:lipopolysaccharide transport system ATP-binding protein
MGTTASREWSSVEKAPGDDVVRLRAVRLRGEDGQLVSSTDIRRPVAVELEYEVLKAGYIFHPHFSLTNDEGVVLFVAQDVDPQWRRRRRPAGRYISTGWIPGNLLAEVGISVGAYIQSLEPEVLHVGVPDAVYFRVVDNLSAPDTARGDYPRPIPGVMRPLLHWTTSSPSAEKESPPVKGFQTANLK